MRAALLASAGIGGLLIYQIGIFFDSRWKHPYHIWAAAAWCVALGIVGAFGGGA